MSITFEDPHLNALPQFYSFANLGKDLGFQSLTYIIKRPFLNINNCKWLQKEFLSTLKRPGCIIVRLVETRDSSPLSMFFISGWVEKNTELKKGFGTILDGIETEVLRVKRFLK